MPILGTAGPGTSSITGTGAGVHLPDLGLVPHAGLKPHVGLKPHGGRHVRSSTTVNTHTETGVSVVSSGQSVGGSVVDSGKTGATTVPVVSVVGKAG